LRFCGKYGILFTKIILLKEVFLVKRTTKSLAFLLALVMLLSSCASSAPENDGAAEDGTTVSPTVSAEAAADETEPPE